MDFQLAMKSNEEFVEARDALKPLLGDVDPPLDMLTRLIRREGGPWMVRIQHPERDLRDPSVTAVYCGRENPALLYDNPWIAPTEVMGIVVKEHPLTMATIELLRGPRSPELEIIRRRRLIRENEERIAAEQAAALARQAQQRKDAERERQLDVEFRAKEWDQMLPISQALTRCALAIEDGKKADEVPALLREMATEANSRKGSLKAPRRIWWKS